MKTNLMAIQLKKEIVHWKRTKQILNRFKTKSTKYTFGLVVVLFGTIFHYCFAFMSTLWNCSLFIFARKYFKLNLQKMALTVVNI